MSETGLADDPMGLKGCSREDLIDIIEDDAQAIDAYRLALHRIQVALDVRCVDDPNKVGCEDRMFDMHEEIARLKANAPD